MILHLENPKEPIQKVLEIMRSSVLQDTRSKYKNLFYFYTFSLKSVKIKLRNNYIYYIIKNKIGITLPK